MSVMLRAQVLVIDAVHFATFIITNMY